LDKVDDFSRITDPDNLARAFRACRRGVDWKESVQRYDAELLRNISETRRRLLAGEPVTCGFAEFDINERGKKRHIKAVHISERVIQKCLCDEVLIPVLSRSLIYDNGASIRGKGMAFAERRLVHHLSTYYRANGYSREGYCLTVDFHAFFDSVRHDRLLAMLGKALTDERVKALAREFITAMDNGSGCGLGLGSQVSQICALYYTNRLDHYIKEVLRVRYYGRYMDDLYLLAARKNTLRGYLADIRHICAGLGITLNAKKTRITPLYRGVHFLKGVYTLTESGKVLRRSERGVPARERRRLRKFAALAAYGQMSVRDIRDAYASWRGSYRRRFGGYHIIQSMDRLYNSLFINHF
jgi:hypothetical protein